MPADTPAAPARLTDEHTEHARVQVALAFQIANILECVDGKPACPTGCDRDSSGNVVRSSKIKLFPDGWHCYRCWSTGNAIDVLQHRTAMAFPDIVRVLNGLPTRDGDFTPPPAPQVALTSFTATVDPVVYGWLLNVGDADAAGDYYARWHIDRSVTTTSGARRILDVPAMKKAALKEFGKERLVECGLVSPKGWFMCNEEYPVIEPHIDLDGRVTSMQFRPSEQVEAEIHAHKLDPDNHPYKAKFFSLRGAPHEARAGFGARGLQLLAERYAGVPTSERPAVWTVEGFKDLCAARTMGLVAYGIPGAKVTPPQHVMTVLAQFPIIVAFDGDEAGAAGRELMLATLAEHGAQHVTTRTPPDGKDMCDVLADRVANGEPVPLPGL